MTKTTRLFSLWSVVFSGDMQNQSLTRESELCSSPWAKALAGENTHFFPLRSFALLLFCYCFWHPNTGNSFRSFWISNRWAFPWAREFFDWVLLPETHPSLPTGRPCFFPAQISAVYRLYYITQYPVRPMEYHLTSLFFLHSEWTCYLSERS